MKPSIKKISEITGFSPATISKALNHKKGINKETSEIIFKTAEEIGYHTCSSINAIHIIFFKTIGTFLSTLSFRQLFLDGVENIARKNNLDVKVSYLSRTDLSLKERLNYILHDPSSAILLIGTEMYEEDYRLFQRSGGLVFIVDGKSDSMPFPSVSLNNVGTGKRAVQYLIQNGHQNIGFIRSFERINAFVEREIGVRDGLARNGLVLKDSHIISLPESKNQCGQVLKDFFQSQPEADRPTAFIADCEMMAIYALNALNECKIQVPKDVSIIGIDAAFPGDFTSPPLTTFDTHLQELGVLAAELIIQYIQQKCTIPIHILADPELIERESVFHL